MTEVVISRHLEVLPNLDGMSPPQPIPANVVSDRVEGGNNDVSSTDSTFPLGRYNEKDAPISKGVVSFLIDFLYYESFQVLFPMSTKKERNNRNSASLSREELSHPFACNICEFVLNEPVSLSCGHSYCKSCVMKWKLDFCRVCKRFFSCDLNNLKCNILVSRFVQEWWGDELKATSLREDCKVLIANRKYEQAIESYSNSLSRVGHDHITLCNRSFVYMKMNKFSRALADADEAILYQPFWAKAYFRRAVALRALERRQEAIVAFVVCAVLEENLSGVRDNLQQTLVALMLTANPDEPPSGDDSSADSRCKKAISKESPSSSNPNTTGDQSPPCSPSYRSHSSDTETSSDPPSDTSAGVEAAAFDHTTHDSTISVGLETLALYLREHFSGSRTSISYELCLRDLFSQCIQYVQSLKGRDGKQYRRRVDQSVCVCADDFECSLCCRLLWQPTTTCCGHTFCRPCLNRWLDHRATCPLCQNPLHSLLAEREWFTTRFLQHAIETLLPEALIERKNAHCTENLMGAQSAGGETADEDVPVDTPVFVCTLALPSLACPLHVFEPRYRLMVRRCMESGRRQFGMCLPSGDASSQGFVDVGVMLEVRDVRLLSDGRSVVHCVGGRRFRCVSKGQCDGYSTAKVQLLSDQLHPTAQQLSELQRLHELVRRLVESWWRQLHENRSAQLCRRVTAYYGQLPEVEANYWTLPDGPAWLWWTLAILPLSHSVQLEVMSMCSLERRLRAVKNVLARLKSPSETSVTPS